MHLPLLLTIFNIVMIGAFAAPPETSQEATEACDFAEDLHMPHTQSTPVRQSPQSFYERNPDFVRPPSQDASDHDDMI